MRVPLSWLREWVSWDADAADLAEALTRQGVAVEAVERPGAGCGGIVAARIREVEWASGSDRLRLCRIEAGGERAAVLTGAPNAAVGLLTAWARPGAVLPGGRRIEAARLRGVLSEGMLCAADELGLPGGHEGLLELDGGLPPGTDLVAALALDDAVLVLDLTPNYAVHCQSIRGVAREVAAMSGAELRPAPPEPVGSGAAAADAVAVEVQDAGLCPLYVARVADGLRIAPSPLGIARRLQQAGMRPVNNVVDATNYVMLETGQPLHAFDLAALRGGRLVVRCARAGEVLVTLDGERRSLGPDDLVIADAERPVALAGVMGGADSEVRPQTAAVALESACFAPDAVARAARRHGMRSEAAARFARGVDPSAVQGAARRAAGLLASLAGGRLARGAVVAGALPPPRRVTLRGARVRSLLGVDVSTAEAGRYLQRLGFDVAAAGADRLRVTVPGWRADVAEEIDLVEEVARLYGYDRIPAALPPGAPGEPAALEAGSVGALVEEARAGALAAGFSEAMTYAFHAPDVLRRLRLGDGHPWRRALTVANPMTADQGLLRTSLLPGLLDAVAYNARHRRADVALFEASRVFRPEGPGAAGGAVGAAMLAGAGGAVGSGGATGAGPSAAARAAAPGSASPLPGPAEPLVFGLVATGDLRPPDWAGPGWPTDFFTLKGLVGAILDRMGVAADWRPAPPDGHPYLHPGRAALISCGPGGPPVGWLGEVHPAVAAAWDLAGPVVAAELDLATLQPHARPVPAYRPWPRFPAVRRDVAFWCDAAVPAAASEAVIRAAAGPHLTACRLFDVYRGADGRRSLAYTLLYQADRTLTDPEVDRAQDGVRTALARELGADLRS